MPLFKSSRFLDQKYKSKRTICNLDHRHPSRLEAGYCNQLLVLKKQNIIHDFSWNKKWELYVNGIWIADHYPDFTIITKGGWTEIHETKGFETDVWGMKKRLFQAVKPDIPYIVIK